LTDPFREAKATVAPVRARRLHHGAGRRIAKKYGRECQNGRVDP